MRAINHALTGAFIGFSVGQPLLAIPLAVGSHFVLDAIPHFGIDKDDITKRWFHYLLIADAVLCLGLVLALALTRHQYWLVAAVSAFAASAPDFLSINRYLRHWLRLPWRPGAYARFATGLQWFERPAGAVVEIAWFMAALICLAPFL